MESRAIEVLAADGSGGMRSKAIRGFVWTGSRAVAERLLSLLTFIILARLLTPRDYGVAAVAGTFAALAAVFASGGVSQTIAQKETVDQSDLDSIFWISLASGLALTCLTVGLAWPLAAFFGLPELKPVLWTLSPMFVALAVASPQVGLLQREFKFAAIARISVTANLLATVIGVSAAFLGAGYWALIVQTLVASVYGAVALCLSSDYRPGTRASRDRFLALSRISRQFMGEQLMNFMNEQTDKAAVGRTLGPATLGVYSVAYRVVFIMLELLVHSVQGVALPVFARLRQDPKRLADGYLSVIRLCTTVSLPVFVYCAFAARDLVVVVFGDKWLAAVPAMQVFCAYGAVQALFAYNTVFLQAIGRARAVLWLAVAGTVLQVVAVFMAVEHGTTWVAASFLLRACALTPVVIVLVSAALPGGTLLKTVATVAPPMVSSAALAVVTSLLVHGPTLRSPWLAVGATVPIGTLVYLAVLSLTGRPHVREVVQVIRTLRDLQPAPESSVAGLPPSEPGRPS